MNRLKVHIDSSPLISGHAVRGIGSYTRNLISTLEKNEEIELVDKNNFPQIIHYPYFDLFFNTLPIFKKIPTIVTIHDIIPLIFPEKYPAGLKGNLRLLIQNQALKNVSAVITDSINSKKDIIKYLGIPEGKITVTYLAASPVFNKSASYKIPDTKYMIQNPYVLYVGDVNYNKNLPRLIEAFSRVLPIVHGSLSLVLVGKAFEDINLPEVKEIKRLLSEYKIEDKVIMLGFVPEEELVSLYRNACVYCQPSLYEGFGLQILEAMACGTPVLTSNVSSCPEVAGNAALLVNPNSVEELSTGLSKIINEKDFRSTMIERGLKQAAKFSWDRTARETIAVYRTVINKLTNLQIN